MKTTIAWLVLMLVSLPGTAAPEYVEIPATRFTSALAVDGTSAKIAIARFAMRVEPVTNAEFLAFIRQHSRWQRGKVSSLLAGPAYLGAWKSPLAPGPDAPARQPVTNVSWFAARAFCSAEQARLPTWYEWEYVAAADRTRRDARRDPARNQDLLAAILETAGTRPKNVGQRSANIYGVRDINRLIWEWTDDYAAMFPNPDARVPGIGALLALCGGSALAFHDKTQYALMMRVAALTALHPPDDAARVGFRCVREIPGE